MRSVVRALLPVAVLLLGLQLAAAGRTLQQTPKSVPVALTRQQFVQATFGLKGVTCDQVSAILNDPFVNNTFSRAVIADFQTQLIKDGWPAAAAVVVAVRQPCLTSNIDGENYASYRTMIRFNSTNSTSTRDTMFAGLSTAVARPCIGGYNRGLYRAVTALFAQLPFNVSQNNGNRQNVFFPNGPGPTGFGDNWIDYASPAMSYCDYLRSPSPSPSPVPSPSPSPEAPSPSPETPSPSPELCPANATRDESGACVCDAGFTSALNGTTVIACLNSTGLTSCPASAPVAVKPVDDPTPMIMSCITQDTPCPTGFTLALYSGNPSVRQECRPNNGGCNYAGFGIQVTTADNTLIGCANSTSNACPFVAYRSAPTFAVDKCVQVTSCPAYSVPSSVLHTVPALEVGSAVPVACLTLDTTTNTCPDLPALRYPLEVVFASGSVNPCGSAAQPCIAAASRTIECRTANATCPAAQSLRLYGGSGATPVVVECRQTRSSCDLTAAGMTTKTPNDGNYNIAVRTGDALDGCIIAGATTCPVGYPFATFNGNALASCTPTVPAVQCTGTQVPLLNANGTTAGCQANNLPCPTTFPITLRSGDSGNVAGCTALTSTCPTAYPFPLYSKFTSVPGVDPSATVLTNCWEAGRITTCNFVEFASGSQPAGIGGVYNVPVVTNATGTEQLLGCVLQGSATCPSAYPFTLFSATYTAAIGGPSPTPAFTTFAVVKCYPAGEVQACAGGYPVPGFTRSALTACIARPVESLQGLTTTSCPASYPIIALTVRTPTSAIIENIAGCYSSNSSCIDNAPQQPFTLASGANAVFCVPQTNGITSCTGYPDATYRQLPIYSPNGLTLIGCSSVGTQCPATFPIFFQDPELTPAVQRCQGSLAGTCASIAGGGFPIPVSGANGTVGCQASGCPNGGIPLRATATGPIQGCALSSAGCSDPAYPTALYSGSVTPVMCLSATGPNCEGAAFSTFNVEVYGVGGTGNVVGCMQAGTDCPGTTVPFLRQVTTGVAATISFEITQCRAGPVTCSGTVDGVAYSIPLTLANGATNPPQGCLVANATTCPGAVVVDGEGPTETPYDFPFFLLASAGNVVQCRAAIIGTTAANQCETLVGGIYTVEIGEVGSASTLAGCAATGVRTSCPAGYIGLYDAAATITSCIPDAACDTATQYALYNNLAVRIGCTAKGTDDVNGISVCTSLFTSSYIRLATNAPVQQGCMDPSAPRCPSTTYTFGIFETTTATSLVPTLNRCLTASIACAGDSPVPVRTTFASNGDIQGCTAGGTVGSNAIRCPSAAPYFFATAAGELDETATAPSFCSVGSPGPSGTSCPSGLGVPVRNTNLAGTSGPVSGCLGSGSDLGSLPCPTTVPAAGTFTFPTVVGAAVGSPATTAGNIVECILPGSTCNGLVPFGSPVVGCISLVQGTCPTTGWIATAIAPAPTVGYTFTLFGQTSTTDATARPVACLASTTANCPISHPILVSANTLANAEPGTLEGCAAANTACPDTYFPLIDGSLRVTTCRTASACPANYIPLCDLTSGAAGAGTIAATTGACTDAGDTQGCIATAAVPATPTAWQVCQRLASTGTLTNYPSASTASASQYKFAVSIDANQGTTVVSCGIYDADEDTCKAVGTLPTGYLVEAYPAGVSTVPATSAFQGCTNLSDAACDSWWGGASSPPNGQCAIGV